MSKARHQLTEQSDQTNPEPISRQNSQALSETRDIEPVIKSSSESSESTAEEETEDEYLPEDNDPGLLENFETLQITETVDPLETFEPLQITEPVEPVNPIKTSQPTQIDEPEIPAMMATTTETSSNEENVSGGGSIKSFIKDPRNFDGERKE